MIENLPVLDVLFAERFVCPRCGRCPMAELEGDDQSPVCDPCWCEITNHGNNPVPIRWRWPSDGGPDLPAETMSTIVGIHPKSVKA